MHHQHERHGTCLCGAVTITATLNNNQLGACHCGICLKWGGGPFFAAECAGTVQLQGEDNISIFDSSDWAQRGFCRQCGTHLFYRLKEGEHYAVPFSLFDAGADWTFAEQIFIEDKPGFYSFAEPTRNTTGAELFAKYPQS